MAADTLSLSLSYFSSFSLLRNPLALQHYFLPVRPSIHPSILRALSSTRGQRPYSTPLHSLVADRHIEHSSDRAVQTHSSSKQTWQRNRRSFDCSHSETAAQVRSAR